MDQLHSLNRMRRLLAIPRSSERALPFFFRKWLAILTSAMIGLKLRQLSVALSGAIVLFVVFVAVIVVHGAAPASDSIGKNGPTQTLSVTEGTNLALSISPDHNTIIMDLQGVLWALPFGGGSATQLTDPLLEPARPDWSPRGDLVAFESYEGGTFHIWVMKPDGTGLRQLTNGHGDDRDPQFSPDGRKIAFSSDRAFAGSYDIWVVDVDGGQLTQWTSNGLDEFEPTWSPDGAEIAFVSGTGSTGTQIEAVNTMGTRRTVVVAPTGTRLNSPSWSPDGTRIAYLQFGNNKSQLMVSGVKVGTSDDVFPFYPRWLSNDQILYTADGKIRVTSVSTGATREIPFQAQFTLVQPSFVPKRFDFDSHNRHQVKGIVSPALAPDRKRIVFEALNQLWVMEIGKKPLQLTNDNYYKEDPAWSPDGKRIAFSSDKSGIENIYVLDISTRQEQRVTSLRTAAAVSPAWSPDGSMLAFQEQNGATFVVELATGNIRQVIEPLFTPSKPTWSANGNTIAVAALKPYTRRFREGTSQILTVDLNTGNLTYTEPAPFKSLSTRGEDGPIYSPDGSAMAFVMDSVLWVRPVDNNGIPTGSAQQINNEVTDAPTWSGDSQQLLYLSNGTLRIIPRNGGSPSTVPLDLAWQPEETHGRTVIHAGHVWDGRGPDVAANVDIVIVNNRIQRIEPHRDDGHGATEPDDRVIDASNLTVIPGLWESHTHQWIEGKFYGDRLGRLWLAYGVTELHSMGDPVYRAGETREAFASGARVGPRYFATGEAIDGERIYYNFMRPTTSDEQLDRELLRAQALDYDFLKTYVRLPHAMQLKALKFAHEKMGVFTGSHYMLPGMAFGMDGMTHVSATTRLGFAYTRSSAGISYQDMRDLFKLPGRFDVSTTFNSSLYAEDPTMVDDPRLLTLNTPWDELGLQAKRDMAVSTDQTVSLDSLQKEESTLISIRRAGGIMLAGTDSPLDNVATALHLNLRSQVKFGLAPWEALQSATLLPAKAFGVANDLGTIEPGKLADFTFVSGNPLQNIKDVANVQAVMKNGRLYTIAELMAPFLHPAAANAAQVGPRNPILPRLINPDSKIKYWWHDPAQWPKDGCAPPQ
jgi:Tol biopolymer transport system component